MRIAALLMLLLAAWPAQARELRVPASGVPALTLDLPRGWQTKPDKAGGVLLIPPAGSQHVMLYVGILHDDELKGAMDVAVAAKAGRAAGVTGFDKQEPARVTDAKGVVHRGTAFHAKVPEKGAAQKRGLFRRAKIVIIPLGPGVWAQAWTVAQPGAGPSELRAVEAVLDSITLVRE
jgi:hypothetical protein